MLSKTYLEISWTFETLGFETTELIQSTVPCHETGVWTDLPRIAGSWEPRQWPLSD